MLALSYDWHTVIEGYLRNHHHNQNHHHHHHHHHHLSTTYLTQSRLVQSLEAASRSSANQPAGITWHTFDSYVGSWVWPRALPSGARNLFKPRECESHKAHGYLSCTASIALNVMPVLAKFIADVIKPSKVGQRCVAHIESFLAIVHVVNALVCVTRGFPGWCAGRLQQLIHVHLTAHLAAYGEEAWVPKHHMSVHLPLMLSAFSILLGTMAMERRHRLIKRYGTDRRTLVGWERCLLEELLVQHFYDLGSDFMHVGLVDPHPPSKHMRAVPPT